MKFDLLRGLRQADRRERNLRLVAAALAAACAAVYFLIGLGGIYPPSKDSDSSFLFVFGFSAGLAFLLGFGLLLSAGGRWVLVLGALFQVFVIWAYFAVAPRRDPQFEIWGISLKVAQAGILAALLGILLSARKTARKLVA